MRALGLVPENVQWEECNVAFSQQPKLKLVHRNSPSVILISGNHNALHFLCTDLIWHNQLSSRIARVTSQPFVLNNGELQNLQNCGSQVQYTRKYNSLL